MFILEGMGRLVLIIELAQADLRVELKITEQSEEKPTTFAWVNLHKVIMKEGDFTTKGLKNN